MFRLHPTHPLLLAAVPLAFALTPRIAAAQQAIDCSSIGYAPAEYRLRIGIDGASDYPLDPVIGHLPYRRYDNMLKHTRKFVTNKFVNAVSFSFGAVELEPNYDFFRISGAPCTSSGCTTYHALTGAPGTTAREVSYAASGQSLQSAPLRLQFQSDISVTWRGVDVTGVAVRCFGSGISNDLTQPLSPGETVDGVLLGPNDIVYLALPSGATPGFHQSVALWSNDATTDIDLLLACGRRPTMSNYDLASRTGANSEYVEFSDATRVCNSGWYLGVHSYAGAGKDGKGFFRLLYARHKASQHITLRAGFTTTSCDGGINPEFAQRAAARTYLSNASAAIFGATDGQVFVNWELYNATGAINDQPLGDTWNCGGAPCNLRMVECHYGGQAYALSDRFWIGAQWHSLDGGTLIHEFGHAHMGMGSPGVWPYREDGYWFPLNDPNTILPSGFPTSRRDLIYNVCGHSAMSNGYLGSTAHKYCTSHNHLRNQRYVMMGWETNVLTSNGLFDSEAGATATQYGATMGVVGTSMDWLPAPHSTRWTEVSDWAVAMHHGVLWYEPDGSDDPYEFLDYNGVNVPGFPGKVIDR